MQHGDARSEAIDVFTEDLDKRLQEANQAAALALRSYHLSERILDLTAMVRILAINAFVKTDTGDLENRNVFSPLTAELLHLAERQSQLSKELGAACIQLLHTLVDSVKTARRYRAFCLAMGQMIRGWPAEWDTALREQHIAGFMHTLPCQEGTDPELRNRLEHSFAHKLNYLSTLRDITERIVAIHREVLAQHRALAQLPQLGAYATQLALIESSRLTGRDDIVSAFKATGDLLAQTSVQTAEIHDCFLSLAHQLAQLTWTADKESA